MASCLDSAKKLLYLYTYLQNCAGSQDLTQISVIELAAKIVPYITWVILMTVGTIICAMGTTYILTSSMYGIGLTLITIGVVLMDVSNRVIGSPGAEKNSDCQPDAYLVRSRDIRP
jgi:hypothetical protein